MSREQLVRWETKTRRLRGKKSSGRVKRYVAKDKVVHARRKGKKLRKGRQHRRSVKQKQRSARRKKWSSVPQYVRNGYTSARREMTSMTDVRGEPAAAGLLIIDYMCVGCVLVALWIARKLLWNVAGGEDRDA